jgi:hypothetical protein
MSFKLLLPSCAKLLEPLVESPPLIIISNRTHDATFNSEHSHRPDLDAVTGGPGGKQVYLSRTQTQGTGDERTGWFQWKGDRPILQLPYSGGDGAAA